MFENQERPQVDVYLPIHNKVIRGDACNLDPNLVQAMPINTAAKLKVEVTDEENKQRYYQLQLAKRKELPLYNQTLRLISADAKYKMEGLEYNPQFLKWVLSDRKVTFEKQIALFSRILGFNLICKINGEHYPVFRAKKFVPWAFQCLNTENGFNHLLIEFELGSDTYQAFIDQLKQNGGNSIEAIKKAHSHPLFTKLGFSLSQVEHKTGQEYVDAVYALYNRNK